MRKSRLEEWNEFHKKLEEEHNNNELHTFCRDVDYYIKQGMSVGEARRYTKYWYKINKMEEK